MRARYCSYRSSLLLLGLISVKGGTRVVYEFAKTPELALMLAMDRTCRNVEHLSGSAQQWRLSRV